MDRVSAPNWISVSFCRVLLNKNHFELIRGFGGRTNILFLRLKQVKVWLFVFSIPRKLRPRSENRQMPSA